MSEKTTWVQRITGIKDRNAILICVGIALIFWFTNALSESYTHDYSFNLDYRLQDNVSFVSPPRQKMEARITGKGWELLKASFKRKFRSVPFKVVRPEVTRSDLIAAIYEHLSDYDVVVREVNIDVMNLDVNMVVTRSLPVRYNLNLTCAEGFVFNDSLHCVPAEVTVTGPASLIERLDPITIEDVQIDPLKENLDRSVAIVVPQQQYITIEPKTVMLEAGVEKLIKITSPITIDMSGDIATVGLAQKSVNISYSVGQSHQTSPELDSMRVVARIGPNELASGGVRLEVVDVPSYVRSLRITPDSVGLIAVK